MNAQALRDKIKQAAVNVHELTLLIDFDDPAENNLLNALSQLKKAHTEAKKS